MTVFDRPAPGVSHVQAGTGPAVWVAGDTYTFKATTESTGGAFALIEASIPPGGGPPPHVHTREDEAFYLLDGVLEITAGDSEFLARTGDFVYLPRAITHCFKNPGVNAVRTLILATPAGFEHFFAEAGTPARPGEQAPPLEAAGFARLAALSQQYGAQIHTPGDTHA
jgi:quercetin dioxygenase-like cupin family protein